MPGISRGELADALQRVEAVSTRGIVLSSDISRPDRELLLQRGYLKDIFKGWYFLVKPTDELGESTAWYSVFWDFLAVYLNKRFGDDCCLSAAASLEIHTGCNVIPRQVIVMTGSGGKTQVELPHDTSLLAYQDRKNLPEDVAVVNELRVMSLPLALCRVQPSFFRQHPTDAEIALKSVKSTADLTRILLETRSVAAAERLAGAYVFLGDKARGEEIVEAMKAAGLTCTPTNPFETEEPLLNGRVRPVSPYAARIEALYHAMRDDIFSVFAEQSFEAPRDTDDYLARVEDAYENDAYNSLSIEGFQVSPELIHRIRTGEWDPQSNPEDKAEADALACRGYLESFNLVKDSIGEVLRGQDVVEIVSRDYQKWYRALFSESVKAGILETHHLAGFRNGRVYIKGSRHVPPPHHAVPDSVDALFSLFAQEGEGSVRAVLGHFLLAFIHPYMDGNGRMARFIMNVMMASGGYPWTIVRMSRRREYMATLEEASVNQNITPFAEFILEEMKVDWSKEENTE